MYGRRTREKVAAARSIPRICAALPLLLLAACGDDESTAAPLCTAETAGPRVITADWLNGTLTVFHLTRLVDPACSATEAIARTIDLSFFPPGPFELALVGDRRALVASGSGFFGSAGIVGDPVPLGGVLLDVDLESGGATPIATSDVPMGIAVAGLRAYVTGYGDAGGAGDTLAVILLESATVEREVVVGGRPEQVRVADDGDQGLVSVDELLGVRPFQPPNPEVSLGAALDVGADPGDIAFLSGQRALVTASFSFGYAIVDLANPLSPTVVENVEVGTATYGATRVPGTDTVLLPGFLGTSTLVVVDAAAVPSVVTASIPLPGGSFPLTAAVDPTGRWAFVAHAQDHVLSVVDLQAKTARAVSWLEHAGPTYVAVAP
jgi:hypothetical protein